MANVPFELFRVVITETSPHQVIVLKETGGERTFPIIIGMHEAWAIHRRLGGTPTVRPFTHELLAGVIEAMGGQLEGIVINDLRDSTFIANLVIRRGQELIEVDSRPSDAIALGAAFKTPIFVAEHVLEQVVRDPSNLAGQRGNLELKRDELIAKITELSGLLVDASSATKTSDEQKRDLQRQLAELRSELETIEEILRHLPE